MEEEEGKEREKEEEKERKEEEEGKGREEERKGKERGIVEVTWQKEKRRVKLQWMPSFSSSSLQSNIINHLILYLFSLCCLYSFPSRG